MIYHIMHIINYKVDTQTQTQPPATRNRMHKLGCCLYSHFFLWWALTYVPRFCLAMHAVEDHESVPIGGMSLRIR